MNRLIFVILVSVSVTYHVEAQSRKLCVVNDPSGTPLNVRARPYGRILGALHNGVRVYRLETVTDNRGDDWSHVVPLGGGREGWVFRDYVQCGVD
jgi:hypothetical protein